MYLERMKNLMRSEAIENAKARAISLTKPLNQTVEAAIYISDLEANNTGNQFRGDLQEVVVIGYSAKKQSGVELPQIEFEKIKLQLTSK